jgi:uncharacterized membrane protein
MNRKNLILAVPIILFTLVLFTHLQTRSNSEPVLLSKEVRTNFLNQNKISYGSAFLSFEIEKSLGEKILAGFSPEPVHLGQGVTLWCLYTKPANVTFRVDNETIPAYFNKREKRYEAVYIPKKQGKLEVFCDVEASPVRSVRFELEVKDKEKPLLLGEPEEIKNKDGSITLVYAPKNDYNYVKRSSFHLAKDRFKLVYEGEALEIRPFILTEKEIDLSQLDFDYFVREEGFRRKWGLKIFNISSFVANSSLSSCGKKSSELLVGFDLIGDVARYGDYSFVWKNVLIDFSDLAKDFKVVVEGKRVLIKNVTSNIYGDSLVLDPTDQLLPNATHKAYLVSSTTTDSPFQATTEFTDSQYSYINTSNNVYVSSTAQETISASCASGGSCTCYTSGKSCGGVPYTACISSNLCTASCPSLANATGSGSCSATASAIGCCDDTTGTCLYNACSCGASGTCTYTCNSGYYDTDGSDANGCESNTASWIFTFQRYTFNLSSYNFNYISSLRFCWEGKYDSTGGVNSSTLLWYNTTSASWVSWQVLPYNTENTYCIYFDASNKSSVYNSTSGLVQFAARGNQSKTGHTLTLYADFANLTVTWSYPPTYSLNSTNSTLARTAVSHNLFWQNSDGLSYAIFSFDNCTGSLKNITGMSLSGTSAWSNFTVVINSTVGCTIRWCVYANNTYNIWNGTSCQNPFSYLTTNALPTLSYLWTSPASGTAYEPGKSYTFNVTACDANGASDLASITFEWNGQTNYTYPTVTNVTHNSTCLNFSITLNDLPAGNYNYKWYVNDSAGASTSLSSSYIIQGPPSLSYLWTSPASGTAYEPGKSYTFNVSVCDPNYYTDNSTVIFEWNGINQTLSPLNPNQCWYWNQTCFNCSITKTDLPANTTGYSYRWYANDSANLWNSSITQYYIIQKATPTLNLLLDNVANDKEVTYPTQTNATAYETNQGDTDITYQLWRNTSTTATLIGSGSNIQDILTLGAGTYYYRYNSSEGQNYTAGEITRILTVNKGSVNIDIWLNDALNTDNSIYYPTQANATCKINISEQNNFYLYRNGTSVGTQVGQKIEYVETLGAQVYNFTCYYPETQNYSSFTRTNFLTVNPGTPTLNLYINDQANNVTITWLESVTIKGNETNWVDTDVTYRLYNDTAEINSTLSNAQTTDTIKFYPAKSFANGTYSFVYNTSGGANWTSAQSTKRYLFVLKAWNQTNNIIAGEQYQYDLNPNALGIPVTKNVFDWQQDNSKQSNLTTQFIYRIINGTNNGTAYGVDPTTFTNINVTFDWPSGFTCNLTSPYQIASLASGETYSIVLGCWGNNLTVSKSGWRQDLSKQSNLTTQFTNETLNITNNYPFALTNVKYYDTDFDSPLQPTCSGGTGTITSLSPGLNPNAATKSCYGDNLTETFYEWEQDPDFTQTTTQQKIRANVTVVNGLNILFTNVYWINETLPSGSTLTCSECSGYFDIPASGTKSWFRNATGDALQESKGPWRQDDTKTTVVNSLAFITQEFNITSSVGIDLSNVDVTQNVTDREGWTCLEKITSVNVPNGITTVWNRAINCSKENVIQINTAANDWQQDNLYTTEAGGYAYIEGNANYTNTDPEVAYANVRINATSYNSSLARVGWNCFFNNSRYSDLNFAAGGTNKTSNYPIQCNASNIITKNEFDWIADNSTEQNISYQKIIKKLNGTNTDSLVSYSNVNARYTEKSGYGNYNDTNPFNISSIPASSTWERWISATNASAIIITTWSSKYSAPEFYQNISINDTGDITFFNLTVWSNDFNDTNITAGTEYVRYWNGSSWISLNTGSLQTNCNSASPTYTETSTPNGTFYVCMQDLGGKQGVADYFKIKIPHTSVQLLQVGGSDTSPPQYTIPASINYSYPKPGEYVQFYSKWQDDVGLSAWIFEWNATGSFENVTSGTLSADGWANTTLQIPTNRKAGDIIAYKFYVNDTSNNWNSSANSFVVWGWANTSVYLYPSSVTYPQTTVINCTVRDANTSQAISNYQVSLYDGSTLLYQGSTDAGGNITYTYQPSAASATHTITCNITSDASKYYHVSSNGTATLTVNKGNAIANMHIAINGTEEDKSYVYPTVTNVTAWETNIGDGDCSYQLYRNTSSSSMLVVGNSEITVLGVDNYIYVFNTSGCENYTSGSVIRRLNITKKIVPLHLAINGTETDQSFTYENVTNVTAWSEVTGEDLTFSLYRNAMLIATGDTTGIISDIARLGVGTYVYIFNTSGGQNYTSNSTSIVLTITPKSISIYLALNGTQDNRTYVYPEAINATAWKDQTINDEGTVTLYRDGVSKGFGQAVTEEILLGNGTYNYTAVFSAYNYTALPVTRFAFVNKGILMLSITGDQTVTYPTQTTVTGIENNIGDADVTYQLWRNDSLVNSSLNPGSLSETILLGAGSYVYRFNASGGQNWTANSSGVISIVTVQQNTSTVNFMNLTIDNAENNKTVTYETYTNATGWYSQAVFGDQQITFTLLRNGQVIGSSNPVTDYTILGNGSYNYTYYTEGNQNYSSASKTYWVFVNKRTPVIKLYLNGTQGDRDYHYGEIVNSTITIDTIYPVTVALWNNLTGYKQWANGTAPLQNLTVLSYPPGKYNFTANFTGDENYTAAYDSHLLTLWHWANVTEINIANLFEGNKLNRSVTPITCRVLDANTSSAIANYPVKFWKNDTLLGTNYTNSTGYAIWYWNSYSDLGPYTMKCNITDNATLYYNASVKEINTSIELWRKLNLELTINPTEIYRNDSFSPYTSTFQANLTDENGAVSGIDIAFYKENVPGGSLVWLETHATDTTGIASMILNPDNTSTVGVYLIKANISSPSQVPYSFLDDDTKYITIKGVLVPTIDSPNATKYIFHKNETMNLFSTIKDENGGSVSAPITFNWTLDGESLYYGTIEDVTWQVPITHASGYFNVTLTVNKTYYATASKNQSVEIWDYYIIINKPTNLTIWHRTESVNLNASLLDTKDNSIAIYSQFNWTLNATQIATGNVTTWNVPSTQQLGFSELNATARVDYSQGFYFINNRSFVYIYGWSRVGEILPAEQTYPLGSIIPVICNIFDANTSEALANYPVKFWKNDTLLGTNYTNSTGYAVWYWNTSPEAAGSYDIKCNITHNATLYYNASYPYENSTTIGLSAILAIDSITKSYDEIYRNDSFSPYNSTIIVHVIEAALGGSSGANVSFYNSTSFLDSCLTNSSGYCNITFNPPDTLTPQNYTIFINATKSGFQPSETKITWVIVKGKLFVSINSPASGSTVHRGVPVSFSSTVWDENYNYSIDPFVGWYNSSWYLIATGKTNNTAIFPIDHPRGSATLYVNVSKQYFDNASTSRGIVVYGYSNVSLLEPVSGNIDRGSVVNVLCQVVDANTSAGIDSYPVNFYNGSLNVYQGFTNSTGYANYSWNTTQLPVGPHVLNCTIADNDTLFYTASFSNAFTSVNLTGNLSASLISVSQQTVYRNDSFSPNSTNVTVRILDEYSSPVEGANVSFYQNESYLGYCQTNSTGYCTYTYNPSDSLQPGNYSIKFNATKTYYYASNTVETIITVKGKLSITIESPSSSAFHRGDTLQLNATVKDENNNFVTGATVNWYNSTQGLLASATSPDNTTWVIPYSYTLGPETLNATATKQFYDSASATRGIEIWRWINVSITSPANESTYDVGSLVNITCRVLDSNTSEAISDYLVKTYIDNNLKGANLTNSTGYTNYTWNTTTEVAGPHTIKCNITDNATLYYNASAKEYEIIVTLTSSLFIDSITSQYSSIYRNDSFSPYATNITVHVKDGANNNIESANVSFYNSTSFLGYCLTNSSGYCYYQYNPPDTLTPQQVKIFANATKPNYLDSSTVSIDVNVTGKLYPVIVYPLNGKFYRNDSIQLNSTTKDENNNFVTPDFASWSLDSESLGNGENITWQVPINHATGSFTLNYSVEKNYYDSNFITTGMEIWSKANITLYLPLDETFDRGVSITYYANVTDYYNSSALANYNCSWWLDGNYLGSSLTNENGICNFTWSTSCANPTRDFAGLHTINSTIGSNASLFYDPEVNSSYTTTTLLGFLNISIDSPANNSMWHKTDTLWLNSTVKDECLQAVDSPTVNWTLNNTEYLGTNVNTTWTIPADHTRGKFFVNATVNKTYYHSAFNISYIEIWGWSNVSWISPPSGTYDHAQVLTLVCKVSDANSSANISNYEVKFYKNENFFGSNLTSSDGTTSLQWDTTPEQLGSYVWKCNITDNSTQYYNVSIKESTATLTLQDVLKPSFADSYISPTELEAYYENVTLRINVTDDISVDKVWANISLPNGGNDVVLMTLVAGNSQNGRYEANYTPAKSQGGRHNVTIYANDTSGNLNSSYIGYFIAYNQTTGYLENNPASIALRTSQYEGASFILDLTLYNTGNATMRDTKISILSDLLPTGWAATNLTSYEHLTVPKASNYTARWNISIAVAQKPGVYNITGEGKWVNPDDTTPAVINNTTVTIQENPILNISQNDFYAEQNHSTEQMIGSFYVNSTGNYELSEIYFNKTIGNLSQDWVEFWTGTYINYLPSLSAGESKLIYINVTIPAGQPAGIYTSQFVVNATNSIQYCQPEENCWKFFNITVNVTQDWSWKRAPEEFSATLYTSTSGFLTNVTITNEGNVNITFALAKSGNASSLLIIPDSITVPLGSSANLTVNYSVPANQQPGYYEANVSITNSSAQPVQLNVTFKLTVADTIPPLVENASLSRTLLEANYESLNISADVSDNVAISNVWVNISLPTGGYTTKGMFLVSGNTYRATYMPEVGGTHYVTVYANDTSGNINSTFAGSFNVIGAATGALEQMPQQTETINITRDRNYTFALNVTLKNIGSSNFVNNGTMRFVNLSLSISGGLGIYSNSTFEQCGNLSVGENCTRSFNITVTVDAEGGAWYYVYVNGSWQNPNGSITNITNITRIYIKPNPWLLLDKESIEDSIQHGTQKSFNYLIQNYGNYILEGISNFNSGGNLPGSWLTIYMGKSYVSKNSNETVIVTVSVPFGQDPGNYFTNITSNATNSYSFCDPATNCWDYLVLNITVPENTSWSISPALQNFTIPTNTTGSFNITVTNIGNVNKTYVITKGGDDPAKAMTTCPASVFVPKASSVNVTCTYDSSNTPGGNYTLILTFSNTTSQPPTYEAIIGMEVTDLPPSIENPSVTPSIVDQNYEKVTISANISDNIEIDMVWINITTPDGTTELITRDLLPGIKSYSLLETYTPTKAGIYYVRIYANDTQTPVGAVNFSQLFNFTSIAETTLNMVLNTTQAKIEGITQDQGASLPVNITLNNTGQGGAYWVNLTASLPSGWSTSPTKVDYQNITEGTWKSNLITINIPAGTSPGLYTATLIAKWTNPSNSLGQVQQTISINVTSNPKLDIVEQSLSVNVAPGQNASANFTLNSTGNDNVTNIQIVCIGQQCTDFNAVITPSSLASLQPLATQLVLINLSVPSGYQPGSYQLMFNASGNNTWDKINLTVNVTQDWRWNRTPESFSASAGVESLGLIGIIEVTNFGNIPILFNVTKEGNASDFLLLNTTQLLVNSLSKGYIEVKYNTSDADGSFYANISITNSSAQPVQMNTTVYLTVIKLRIDLISPNQSYPVEVKAGDTIQIRANATYEGIITENMTWKVYVGQAECPVTSYNFLTNSWLINCTAPSLPDGKSYALAVYGNYTNYNAVASDSEPNAVYYTDVTPPSFSNVSANSVKQGGTVLIQADIPDNVATTQAKAEVTFPSGFKVNFTMTNTSLVHYQYEFTNTQELGDYDFKIYAQDEKGNTNTTEGWFEVYTEIMFNGTTKDQLGNPVKTYFQFYRNNKPKISYYLIHNFSSNETTGIFNQTLHNRSYDAVITFFKDKLEFAGLETRHDIQQNILIGNLTAQAVNIPNAKTKLRGIALNMSFNFTNVTITLDYSDYIGNVNVEDDIRIFKCENWDFVSWNCNSSWTVLPTTLDKIAHRASTTTTSLSAYFVGEYQEVVPTTTTLPAGGGGGAGPGPNITLPVCGNGICETGENWQNCPQDCPIVQKPIQFSTEAIEVTLAPGEYRIVSLGITNNLDKKVTANLSVEGRIWEFTQFEKTSLEIEKGATEYVLIKFFALSSTPLGNYVGEIVVRADNATSKIPVTMRVEAKPSPLLDITMDVLTPKLRAGETLTLRVTVFTFGEVGTVDVTINYTVQKAEVMEKILTTSDTVAVDRRLEYTKSIKLPSDLEEGRYLVEAFAYYDNKTATSVVSFEVFKEPPIVVVLRNLFADWRTYVVIAVIAVSVIGVRKYIAWKIAQITRKKYVFPLDFRKLPKGVKIGKIAETNIDAYWDLDKLTQHMIIAGGTGSGKTVAAMILAEEALKKGIPVIVFDPTAQWTGFVRPSRDEHMLSLYPKFGLRREDAMAFRANIIDVVDPNMKIEVEKCLNKGEITVFCLTKLTPSQLDDFVSRTIDAIFSVPWEESKKLRLLIVYDEVHRLLPKYGGRKGYLALERGVREFRKWGIGLVMISQVLSDFKGAIRAVIASECQMRTKYSGDIDRVKKSYGSEYAATLPKLNIGTGMVQNPEYNEGKPWFIEFRPLLHDTSRIPERELALYRKYQEEIAEIEKVIESMKKRGIDTYDMELELRLAKEKVKQAQFRMAETYIESLKARIKRGK